ncbi:alanine--glyoxylate aminotransferase family protein [Thalassobium sp. R2A62]|uniref:pyridoxal-phosphate-dependent aminotransferase family protein n=1 Tax=Thalassobium sp. R2A62 TaxID=633131 RepID=UPI0005941B95|nr:aminotransferase class V-fold PLP-dependent enzyme [Thalassobium sp. R2A62]
MSLANGRRYLAIPGPSVMPDSVLRAMHRAAPNIYTGELHDVTASLIPDLKQVARTEHHAAIYIGNGHGVWEAALANTLSRGDTVLVLATGRFAHGWGEIASKMGITVDLIEFGQTSDIDPQLVTEHLRADTQGKIKAVLSVFVDTSTSVKSDVAAVRAAIDAAGHPALLLADCIASLGCDRFEMDAWGVDVMVTASQKGLMTPPGVGFVFFNDKANAARDTADCVTHYWNWRPRIDPDEYYQYFDGTAPTHHIYGLRAALDMIHDEGLENVWARHETFARVIWTAVDVWNQDGPLKLNVPIEAQRSHAVTSLEIGSPDGDRLRNWMENHAGVTLGIGLGRAPQDAYFRIGHMGHVNSHMVMGVLATLDAGLKALNIPHGRGAIEAAATVLANHAGDQLSECGAPGNSCCG